MNAPFALVTRASNLFSAVTQESPDLCDSSLANITQWCDQSIDVFNPSVIGDPYATTQRIPRCAWDGDDAVSLYGIGYLRPGASESISWCVIYDTFTNTGGDNHPIGLDMTSDSPSLTVTLTNDAGAQFTASPVSQTNENYRYVICESASYNTDVVPIAESNGGTGETVTWTFTVTNPTGRTVRNNQAEVSDGFANNPYLVFPSPC